MQRLTNNSFTYSRVLTDQKESVSMSTLSQDLPLASHTSKWPLRFLSKKTQYVLDLMVLSGAFILSYLLRFDFSLPQSEIHRAWAQLIFVVLIQFAALSLTGVYSFVWRYVGLTEVRKFLITALWSVIPILFLRLGLTEQFQILRVPLSVIVFDTALAFGGVLGIRVLRRVLYERDHCRATSNGDSLKKRILLVGAGRAGVLTVTEIKSRGDIDLKTMGFVDDDPLKKGSVIHGVKVLGTTEDLPELVKQLEIDHVVISFAQASREDFRRILNICEEIPIKVRIIPGLYELLQDKVKVSRIRDVQIEDLLGREPVQLDEVSMNNFLAGKTVLVTGAGGSIGSELARQVARLNPSNLLLVERSEFALFNIERDLRSRYPHISLFPLIGDIGDEERMRRIFRTYRPQLVIHAAAHKHVPMMELNAVEALKNNILGTRILGELSGAYEAEAFVLISTDKAVRPTSVMGATKRVAELVIQSLDSRYATRFLAVRFGNVIGSAGSVIPIFREQIQKGGPITVTHPDMKRYFMTIPEAAQLVLQAGALGEGGEIFVLDMGEPVSILDMAKETIRLSGLRPFEDIEIVFSGMRPGEKLTEELELTDEQLTKTRHPKIFIGNITPYTHEQVWRAVEQIERLIGQDCDATEVRMLLSKLLPEAQLETVGKVLGRNIPMLPEVAMTAVENASA